MELISMEALVIGKQDLGESDRFITLLNKDHGKIKILIKGIRKSKNREIYATEPLVVGEYKLRKKGETYINNSFSLIKPYLKIKENFFKLELSLYLLKLVEKITYENINCKKLYSTSLKALDYIENTRDKNKILIMFSFFMYKIIEYEGLKPKILGKTYFNYEKGYIDDSGVGIKLEANQYKYIEFLNFVDIDAVNELKFSDIEILKTINILENYLNRHLHLELNIINYFREEK